MTFFITRRSCRSVRSAQLRRPCAGQQESRSAAAACRSTQRTRGVTGSCSHRRRCALFSFGHQDAGVLNTMMCVSGLYRCKLYKTWLGDPSSHVAATVGATSVRYQLRAAYSIASGHRWQQASAQTVPITSTSSSRRGFSVHAADGPSHERCQWQCAQAAPGRGAPDPCQLPRCS